MDVEKTMQFILDQQAAFMAKLEAERAERLEADRTFMAKLETERAERLKVYEAERAERLEAYGAERAARFEADKVERDQRLESEEERIEADRKLGERLDALTSLVASLTLNMQAHEASMEDLRSRWRDFIDRFDRYLSGQGGNGKRSPRGRKRAGG